MASTIRVEGLSDIQRAFARYSRDMGKDLKAGFESAAEPVERAAEANALRELRPGNIPWHEMRTGVTRKSVYIAPQQRGNKSRTRTTPRGRAEAFKRKMLDKSMEPALEDNRTRVIQQTKDVLGDLARAWGRV